MSNIKKYEWTANIVIVLTLCLVILTSFSGGFYGNYIEKETYLPIYKGNSNSNKISLMINVYWGDDYVLPMANLLSSYNFKTTFFIGGSWASKNHDIVKKLYDMGFEIANHGYNHKDHSKLNIDENKKEILVTERLLSKIIGNNSKKLFAPPSGYIGNNMTKVCQTYGYKVIMWTRDTVDWRDKDSKIIYDRTVKNMSSGDLILMHPTEHTLNALKDIIEFVILNNFVIVPVSENIV